MRLPKIKNTSDSDDPGRPATGRDVVRWGDPTDAPRWPPPCPGPGPAPAVTCPTCWLRARALPPEFDELLALTAQRLRGLQADAQRAAGRYVERVLANCDPHETTNQDTDKARSQASWTVARRTRSRR